jgi:mono/diheme cytochrome c family protein
MIRAGLVLLLPVLACAQDMLNRGANLYNTTCASGYCHGAKGGAGGSAPRLASRGFSEEYISQTVRRGISGTAMPAFGTELPRGDVGAIIAYVASLNGITATRNPPPGAEPEKKLPPDAARGRALFFDAVRGFGRCATCHEADGMGVPVASAIATVPASAADLQNLATARVRTATVEGESFPALAVSQGSKLVKVYDLTSPPPVLRTFAASAVTMKEGSGWKHASAVAGYNDAELDSTLVFLRAVTRP